MMTCLPCSHETSVYPVKPFALGVWERGQLRGHTDAVYSATFSPDGTRVITASADGSTRIFLTRPENLLALAQLRATRTLTVEEKVKYLHESF